MERQEAKGRKNLSLSKESMRYLEDASEKTKISQSQIVEEIILRFIKGKEIESNSLFRM